MTIGGIDLGGTKIEARLFDDNWTEVARDRIATPTESYAAMMDGIATQIRWLEDQAPMQAIGLGTPGLINPRTGVMLTANLPATGETLASDISHLVGREITVINDCRAFTLSEATLGAGKGHRSVVGLVIGTGVAGGQSISGRLLPDMNGQHGEYGHLPLPARVVADYNLSLLPCGCGLTGCFETYLSGPGLVRLSKELSGQSSTTQDILSDPSFAKVRAIWIDLIAALVAFIARTSDPNVVVLGGGLGMAPGLPEKVSGALAGKLLDNTSAPLIEQAHHGDASGALGAALFAQQQAEAA